MAYPDGRLRSRFDRIVVLSGYAVTIAAGVRDDVILTREQPELVESVAAATRLAMDNQQLESDFKLSREMPSGLENSMQPEGGPTDGSQSIPITVLMSGIPGYSAFAERAAARVLARQLAQYRETMARVITAHGGTVMQFVGDAIFAVFGAPMPLDDHAATAVAAAVEMQARQREIAFRSPTHGEPLNLGIGITTGRVTAALQPEQRLQYSLVGDVIELAQRIQDLAGAGEVVVSAATFAELDGRLMAERLSPITLSGRDAPVVAYSLSTGTSPFSFARHRSRALVRLGRRRER